ncbi:MAG: acyl carrier protein [Verrucomicrobiota bacterium]
MKSILSEKHARAIEEILTEELEVQPEQLKPEARLIDDLGADSLTIIEITMMLEERFSLTIPDERWETVRTVGDLYEALAELLQRHRRQ